MKRWYVLLFVFLTGFFMAGAELSEDELEDLQDTVNIRAVNDDTFEDDFDVEFFLLKFATTQRVTYDKGYNFYVRVTVELTDKKTSTIRYAQFARARGGVDTEYTGEDEWQFLVNQGDMHRPKVTAYVIQYGVLVDQKFIVAATETDDVDTLEELMERTKTRLEATPVIQHQHFYNDSDGAVQTSGWE